MTDQEQRVLQIQIDHWKEKVDEIEKATFIDPADARSQLYQRLLTDSEIDMIFEKRKRMVKELEDLTCIPG